MDERVFLGWDEPLLGLLVDWFWERRSELPEMLVVVPTAQAGRRLREGLAEKGVCLAPRVVTPGSLLHEADTVPEAMELVAWVEVLEGLSDWAPYEVAFPITPGLDEAPGWALALARSLAGLERSLRENALTVMAAAKLLASTVEAERWKVLANLAAMKEACLRSWGVRGRNQEMEVLAGRMLDGRVVLAGVQDLPGALVKRLERADGLSLVAAPEELAGMFDQYGRPLAEEWSELEFGWPECGEVELTADPWQQAKRAVERVAEEGTKSCDLALGSADEETAGELVRAFGRAGWVIHNPAGMAVAPGVAWLSAWRGFVAKPDAAAAIDLLGQVQTGAMLGGGRAQRVAAISGARDRYLVRDLADGVRAAASGGRDRETLELACESMEKLGSWRGSFLREPFVAAMDRMLERVDLDGEMLEAREWLLSMEEPITRLRREPRFWMDLLISEMSGGKIEVPEDRVADVQGWLELLHEPGSHLLVCGMNEGKVPKSPAGDTWLPEGVRELLGLGTVEMRAAQDAYVLRAMVEARRGHGRVDLLLAKSGADGDALLPSRLLLAAEGEELARRVKLLFAGVEPPDAGMASVVDWKWNVRALEMKPRMSVTALSGYLSCPLRFYLKQVLKMGQPEPERGEWNPRDFGNVCHVVLERWALDEEAREFSKSEAIEKWVHAELERVVKEQFGEQLPLAVRIQCEGMKQRLSWFSRHQACERAAGWRVVAAEMKFETEIDGVVLVGTVDRVDEHQDGRRRVLDYKTYGKRKKVEADHRTAVTARTKIPEHLKEVSEVRCHDSRGKDAVWRNLQVPMYSVALGDVDELGYFLLGATEADTGLEMWPKFGEADQKSAQLCAEWVLKQVKSGVFWPPAEKIVYDDFEVLAVGRTLEEVMGLETLEGVER